jgi:hypothetical protein
LILLKNDLFMLRRAQHERKIVSVSNVISVRPEQLVEGSGWFAQDRLGELIEPRERGFFSGMSILLLRVTADLEGPGKATELFKGLVKEINS